MTGLVEWLRAQVTEDEDAARAAARYVSDSRGDGMRWTAGEESVLEEGTGSSVAVGPWGCLGDAGPHIAAWDPSRVLAECAAKRAILAEHPPRVIPPRPDVDRHGITVCDCCTRRIEFGTQLAVVPWPCPTVLAVAQPYADRPGWREEWRLG